MSSMEFYKYEPLTKETSIRILALQPCLEYDAELRCDLVHCDRDAILQGIDEVPHYEPVSYVWGSNPIFSHTLVTSDGQLIAITSNVDEILRVLRKPTRTRNLWIDAICLNQEDAAEKSKQVHLMDQIFSQGRKTHIYLNSFASLGRPLQFLKRFDNGGKVSEKSLEDRDAATDDFVDVVVKLLQNPWFSRRWVLQEAALSRHAIIRTKNASISWEVLKHAVPHFNEFLQRRDIHAVGPVRHALDMVMRLTNSPRALSDLILNFQAMECTNPMDRVYSLYGLVDRRKDLLPTVDYSLLPSELCTQIAMHVARAGPVECLLHSLTILGSLHEEDSTLPSWVPMWCGKNQGQRLPAPKSRKSSLFDDSGNARLLGSMWHTSDTLFAVVEQCWSATPMKSFHEFELLVEMLDCKPVESRWRYVTTSTRVTQESIARTEWVQNVIRTFLYTIPAIERGNFQTSHRLQAFVNAYAWHSVSEHHQEILKACQEELGISFDETTPPLQVEAAMSIWNTDMKNHTFCRYTRKPRTRTRYLSPPGSTLPLQPPPSLPPSPPETFIVLVPGKSLVGDLIAELSTRFPDLELHGFPTCEVVLRQANDVDVASIDIVLDLAKESGWERDVSWKTDELEVDQTAYRLVSVIHASSFPSHKPPYKEVLII